LRNFCIQMQFVLAAFGCAAGNRAVVRAPLDGESEVRIEVRRPPPGVKLDVEAVGLANGGTLQIPLELRQSRIGSDQRGERLLASGRIPPGHYSGFAIRLHGREDAPVRTDAPFIAVAGRTTVLAAEVAADGVVTAQLPAKTLPQLTGLCAETAEHDLTLFDRRARVVSEVLPTGRRPSGIAVDPVQSRAFVALEGEDLVDVLDVASSTMLARIRLSIGDGPRDVALTPDRRVLVTANAASRTISFLDATTWIELGRVPAGEEPSWILIDRGGVRAYVSNLRSSSITVVDIATRSVVATIATDDRPLRPQLDRTGARLYVATQGSPYLSVYSLPDLALQKRVYVGLGVSALKVDSASDLVYVGHRDESRLVVYDPFSFIPVDSVQLPDAAGEMAIDDAENALFVLLPETRSLAVIDLNRRRLLSILDLGDGPRMCALMGERN
jgi:YVTN family beta-propeller protein